MGRLSSIYFHFIVLFAISALLVMADGKSLLFGLKGVANLSMNLVIVLILAPFVFSGLKEVPGHPIKWLLGS
jgi:hypothetical protein